MPEIEQLVMDAFKGMPIEQTESLQLLTAHSRHVSRILSGERTIELTNNQMLFQDTKPLTFRADNKRIVAQLLSAQDDFAKHAKIPKTFAFPRPDACFGEPIDPDSDMPQTIEDIIACVEKDLDYPVFVKPNKGSKGKNAISAKTPDALFHALLAIYEDKDPESDGYAVIQEKIKIEREYRCVMFNGRARLVYDRMFKERTVINGRVDDAQKPADLVHTSRHIECPDLRGQLEAASKFVTDVLGIEYGAVDWIKDTNGVWWYGETNAAPIIFNAYHGPGIKQMHDMARDVIAFVRG